MRAYAVRLVALVGLLLVGLVSAPGAALASCAGRDPAQVAADSDVVLTGLLVAVDDPKPSYGPYDVGWTIEVAAVHKGRAPATAHVVATTYSHEDVVAGGSHVFALDLVDGTLRAQGCQDLEALGTPRAAALVAAAGPAGAPPSAGSGPGSTAPPIAAAAPWWSSPLGLVGIAVAGLLLVTVGGLGLAVVAALVVARRRRDQGPGPPADRPSPTGTPFK
jgi:hypothetical protein